MGEFIRLFVHRLRLSKPWNYKVPLLMIMPFFLLNAQEIQGSRAVALYACALITSVGFAGFGYATNDLSDIDADRVAGKSNSAIAYGKKSMLLIAFGFLLVALLPWLYLPSDRFSLLLIVVEFLLFILYAFPPFRLKNKGLVGVFVDALYAYVVPAMLATWTFYLAGDKKLEHLTFLILPLTFWLLFVGLRGILYHQLADFDNDALAGSRTWVQSLGKQKTEAIVRLLLPVEIGTLAFFLWCLSEHNGYLPLLFGMWMFYAVYLYWRNKSESVETPYKQWTNVLLDQAYTEWLPLVILLTVGTTVFSTWVILCMHLAFFRSPLKECIRGIHQRILSSWLLRKFVQLSNIKQGLVHFFLVMLFIVFYLKVVIFFIQMLR